MNLRKDHYRRSLICSGGLRECALVNAEAFQGWLGSSLVHDLGVNAQSCPAAVGPIPPWFVS